MRSSIFRGEGGFALIAALLSLCILAAVGILVFTVTTQDVRVSTRVVGERKAFYAAEAGVHKLTEGFNPADPGASAASDVLVDPGNDPGTRYTIGAPPGGWYPRSGPGAISYAGFSIGGGDVWGEVRYLARVTGRNTRYGTNVEIDTGVGYGPVDITTLYR